MRKPSTLFAKFSRKILVISVMIDGMKSWVPTVNQEWSRVRRCALLLIWANSEFPYIYSELPAIRTRYSRKFELISKHKVTNLLGRVIDIASTHTMPTGVKNTDRNGAKNFFNNGFVAYTTVAVSRLFITKKFYQTPWKLIDCEVCNQQKR